MTSIASNIQKLKKSLPEHVTLIAVSKTKPIEDLMEAYNAGQRIFGENRVQEMADKQQEMPEDVAWHMIGHVQRNKVKYMAPFVSMIHAVDSPRLLKEINKEAGKNDRVIDCLLQIKIAREESKYGLSKERALELLKAKEKYPHVNIKGLMGMATFTEDLDQVAEEFREIKKFFDLHQDTFGLKVLSIGMSGDYMVALENGSTMVRIGSAIFGARD